MIEVVGKCEVAIKQFQCDFGVRASSVHADTQILLFSRARRSCRERSFNGRIHAVLRNHSVMVVPHNAAVERPRDHVSSAPRVHNEMTHMRRARAAV